MSLVLGLILYFQDNQDYQDEQGWVAQRLVLLVGPGVCVYNTPGPGLTGSTEGRRNQPRFS
jgi:hypothetical protein